MYYVYIIKSKKDKMLYTGSTNDLNKRLELHNKGKVFSTKKVMMRLSQRRLRLRRYQAGQWVDRENRRLNLSGNLVKRIYKKSCD